MMEKELIHDETGRAWDVASRIYERDEERDVELLSSGGTTLLDHERRLLKSVLSGGETAVHLQCSAGSDTLSLLQLGVSEVIGIDISGRMIEVARRKSAALSARARWIVADAVHPPKELFGVADLVYTGRGALPWMMDLTVWAETIHELLKPGGVLFLHEGHPLDWVWDTGAEEYRFLSTATSYFAEELRSDRWPAPLLDDLAPDERPLAREHQWTLGHVINSLVDSGMEIRRLEEHPEPFWNMFENMPPETLHRLPHTYSLIASKP